MKVIVVLLIVFTTTIRRVKTQQNLEEKIYVEKTVVPGSNDTNIQNEAAYNKQSVNVELMNGTRNRRFSYLHAIEEDLLHQNWEEEEQPCLHQLVRIIKNVQNSTLWATWIWDSMQPPVGQLFGSRNHLGNYDQCMNYPWQDLSELTTQYCLAEFSLSELDPEITDVDIYGSVQKYIRTKTKHGLRYNTLTWGICAPEVCKAQSISKFADAMFRSTHLGQMEIQHNVSVNSAHCHIAGEFQAMSSQELIFITSVILIIIITVLCTCFVDFKGTDATSTSVLNVAKAFDIKSNTEWLMKVGDKSIKSLLGIRLVSSFAVVSGHLWFIKNAVGVGNAGEIDKQLDKSTKCTMFTVDLVVDIFFMISGLLLTKSIMEKKVKNLNFFSMIAKRYIRLVCSVLVIMLMISIALFHGNSGPLIKKILQVDIDTCAANWWKIIVMIGNYGDTSTMCYPVLWSLPCEFHLFLIGILICWIYQKSKKAGIKAYITCAVASVTIPVINGYISNTGAVTSFDFRVSDNYRKFLIGDPAYVRTHLRAGPYFVGMAAGYLMVLFRPEKYRNVISKKSSVLAFLVLLFMFASLITLSGIYHMRQYGPLEGALFSVMRRNVFAALIGAFIFICEYGSLPYVNSALGWSALSPFSKLSYGVYLFHLMFTLRFTASTRVPLQSDPLDDIFSTISMMVMTMTLSFFMWIFWEAPTINLLEMVFKRFAGKVQQNGKIETNEKSNGKINGKLFTALEEYEQHNNIKEEKKIN